MGRPTSASDTKHYSGRLGIRLRARREQLKITAAEMSQRLTRAGFKTAAVTVYQYEAGMRPVPVDSLPAFAKVLETTIHRLLPRS